MVYLMMFFLVVVLAYFLWDTSKYYGLIGSKRASKKATKDAKEEQKYVRMRGRVLRVLSFLSFVDTHYGLHRGKYAMDMLDYKIKRLEIKMPYLNRNILSKELSGLLKILSLVGIFGVILGYVLTGSLFSLLFLLLLGASYTFHLVTDLIIFGEDALLERDFPEFYFVIHNKLMSKASGRLAPVIKDYINARDTPYHRKEYKVILAFATDFLSLLELYKDDTLALQELRKKYSSITFINFANLASQRLQGIDNRDKLQMFSAELQRKNNEKIDKKADKAVKKGQIAVAMIGVVLLKYILLMLYLKVEVMMNF